MNADLVMFAIQGGLELYGSIRTAYVNGTIGAELVLPLPRSEGTNSKSALTWFNDKGKKHVKNYPRVGELVAKPSLTGAEKRELTTLYLAVRSVVYPSEASTGGDGRGLNGQELNALLSIRQWKNDPNPTALQQVAGTLVNIAVDYFLQTPGAISDKQPAGRALRTFLELLDKKDFSKTAVADIAPDLLIALLDSVAQNPELVRGGEKEQLFVKNITESMLVSAKDLLKNASKKERENASVWIQLVARSLIEGGTETVLDNPKLFFKVKPGEEALIVRVGKVMTDLVLTKRGVDLQPLLSGEGLERITRTVLETVAKHPELLHIRARDADQDKGIRLIISSVAEELARFPKLLSEDVFAEMSRLLLEKTAENLELVWGKSASDANQHLLILATRSLLDGLSKSQSGDGSWKPELSGDLLLGVAETVFQDVIDNPQWVIEVSKDAGSTLGRVVTAVTASLKRLDGELISTETGLLILRTSIGVVGQRLSLLDDLPLPAATHGKAGINHALDAIFDTVFGAGSEKKPGYWVLARNSTILMLVEVGLDKLAQAGGSADDIEALRQAIENLLETGDPFDPESFEEQLDSLLAAAA